MIAVDTNILVYAHRPDLPFHERAAAEVRRLAEGTAVWALPWPCLHEFLAVVTNGRIFATPTPLSRALEQVAAWTAAPTVRLLTESPTHAALLAELAIPAQVSGSQIHDTRIAALCLAHGVRELLTMDRDFSRYPALNTRGLLP